MKRLLGLLLTVMSGAALAQTTGTVNPSPTPAEPSVKEDVPPGGCMPIGLTASGEIVFPIQCKEFIERQRGKAVEQKPAAKQSEGVAPENSKPAIKPVETVPLPKSKRVEHEPRERAMSPDDGHCSQRYRSYDPASGTYTSYDGRRLPCP
jgi:BA14K-like protein